MKEFEGRPRLWTIEDVKAWLCYDDTATAVEAVKARGIPHIVVGAAGGKIGDKGVTRRLRFLPSALEAWAESSQVVFDPAPVVLEAPVDEKPPVPSLGGGWRAAMGGTGRRRASSKG